MRCAWSQRHGNATTVTETVYIAVSHRGLNRTSLHDVRNHAKNFTTKISTAVGKLKRHLWGSWGVGCPGTLLCSASRTHALALAVFWRCALWCVNVPGPQRSTSPPRAQLSLLAPLSSTHGLPVSVHRERCHKKQGGRDGQEILGTAITCSTEHGMSQKR